MKKTIFILLLIPCLCGCASILYRTSDDYKYVEPGPYPAVRCDVQNVDSIIKKEYPPSPTWAEPTVFLFSLIDIPIAAVIDTIILPYDMQQPKIYARKTQALLNKYLPGYTVEKSLNVNEEGAFYLRSPSGEKINVFDNQGIENNERTYPEMDKLLKQHNIPILSDQGAIELARFLDMLYGKIVTSRWRYEATSVGNRWLVKITDVRTGKRQLGNVVWVLETSSNLLRRITSRSS